LEIDMVILDDSHREASFKAWSLVGFFPLLVLPWTALAEEVEQSGHWGGLRIRFTYDGMDHPKLEPFPIFKDVEVMKKFDIVDERWVVDPKTLGLANVVVYMEDKGVPVHDSYGKDAKAAVPLTFRRGRFDPHVVCVRSSQTLEIGNADPVAYSARCSLLMNSSFNVVAPRGAAIPIKFTREERLPARLADNIHPWVRGWMLVRESPYMGSSSKDGLLELNNVPAGTWTFRFWHEEVGFLSGLGRKGQLTIEIKPGETRELVVRLRKDNKGTLMKSTSRSSS
jgi:hypothetical protein